MYSLAIMNKKIVLGCLGIVAVVVIVGSIAGYFYIYKPGMEYVQSFSNVGKLGDMDSQVQNTQSFSPPEGDLLTEDQVNRFVQVQRAITSQMGAHLAELKQKYSTLSKDAGGSAALAQFITFWKDTSAIILQAKEVQVQALNDADFSLEEYQWVRTNFYRALGANFVSLNLSRAMEAIQKQNPELLKDHKSEVEQMAPQQNRELVEPYADESQSWIAYAWVGL